MRLTLLVILAAFLSAQPLSAQPLPSYDLSYYDSLECIKEKADSFAKNTLIPNKTDEAVGKSICQISESCRAVFTRRHGQAVGHNSI
ncbi:MAG: hypothetical protein WCF50_13840 [Pseudolabrys sp.]